jgi:hypothetical protein
MHWARQSRWGEIVAGFGCASQADREREEEAESVKIIVNQPWFGTAVLHDWNESCKSFVNKET